MLLFGNEGTGKGRTKSRKPSSGSRQLRADFDPNREREGKGPSPPSMFMPVQDAQEAEGLRLPRLPTPDARMQDDRTKRDSLRPVQEPLQPLTHRGAFTHREGGDGAENIHENRARPSSSSPEVAAVMMQQGSLGRSKALDDADSRSDGTSSRSDGRAWEDSEYENPKDPILNSFRELRLQVQVMNKKDPGSKDFKTEQKALETRLKRIEAQVMSDRQALMRRGKAAKMDTNQLQSNLKSARDNMQATMQQAADDVIALTQKLQDVEDKFAQCRVDKDHLERSFTSEMEVLRKKCADTEQRLEAAFGQQQEQAERMRDDREEARKNKRARAEAESAVRALEEQLDAASQELVALKTQRSQLQRKVEQLESDVELQKANVRNEEERVKMEKDRHNERVKSLEAQLERCMEESSALEEYKAEAKDARRKLEQAEGLLDEAEKVQKEAVRVAQATCAEEKADALERAAKELETVKRQLSNAVQDKSDAASRAQQANSQLQVDLQSANAKLQEANKARIAAQEELKTQTASMLEQLKRAQEDGARHLASAGQAKDELLKLKEGAQEKELDLKEQMVSFKLQVSELTFSSTELQAKLDRSNKDLAACNAKLKEAEELLSSSTAQSDLDALKKLMREKDALIAELKGTIESGEERLAREREALKKSRDAMYEMERRMEELEVLLARTQAEKDVSAAMVHQLMSQLSKARMDKMMMLKGGDSMTVQEQHAHMQQLLMSAKQHSQQVASLVERVPHAKKEAVKKYMNDLESSRASSRQSMALDDDAQDPFMGSRDPSRAPSAARLGPAEAALSLDPVDLPAAPAATGNPVAEGGEGGQTGQGGLAAPDGAVHECEIAAVPTSAGGGGKAQESADRSVDADGAGGSGHGAVDGAAGAEPAWQTTAESTRAPSSHGAGAEVEGGSAAAGGGGEGGVEGGEGAGAGAEGVEGYSADAEAAAVKIQAIARGGRDRAKMRNFLEEQMAEFLGANPDVDSADRGVTAAEQQAAAEPEAAEPAAAADASATVADAKALQPATAGDEFVKPTPPASRPTSARPASASLRRGGSRSSSRVNSPLPGAGAPAP